MSALSSFQFIRHEIPQIQINIPGDYSDESPLSVQYCAKYRTYHDEGRWTGDVMLAFRKELSPQDSTEFLYEIVIVGGFTSRGENTEEDKESFVRYLKTSGATTLIPIARAALVSTSAIMGHPDLCTIPNINVYNLNWTEPEAEDSSDAKSVEPSGDAD